MLAASFFPARPPEDTPLQFVYPKPVCKLSHILKEQIKH